MPPHSSAVTLAAVIITLGYLVLAGFVVHRTPAEQIPQVLVRLASLLLVLPVVLYGPEAMALLLGP